MADDVAPSDVLQGEQLHAFLDGVGSIGEGSEAPETEPSPKPERTALDEDEDAEQQHLDEFEGVEDPDELRRMARGIKAKFPMYTQQRRQAEARLAEVMGLVEQQNQWIQQAQQWMNQYASPQGRKDTGPDPELQPFEYLASQIQQVDGRLQSREQKEQESLQAQQQQAVIQQAWAGAIASTQQFAASKQDWPQMTQFLGQRLREVYEAEGLDPEQAEMRAAQDLQASLLTWHAQGMNPGERLYHKATAFGYKPTAGSPPPPPNDAATIGNTVGTSARPNRAARDRVRMNQKEWNAWRDEMERKGQKLTPDMLGLKTL